MIWSVTVDKGSLISHTFEYTIHVEIKSCILSIHIKMTYKLCSHRPTCEARTKWFFLYLNRFVKTNNIFYQEVVSSIENTKNRWILHRILSIMELIPKFQQCMSKLLEVMSCSCRDRGKKSSTHSIRFCPGTDPFLPTASRPLINSSKNTPKP